MASNALLEFALKDLEGNFEKQWVIHYPNSATFPHGVGRTIFDFRKGEVFRYDGVKDSLNTSLESLLINSLKTLYFWSDIDVDLKFAFGGKETGKIDFDQCVTWSGIHLPFDKLELSFPQPGNFELVASTSLKPWNVTRNISHQMRFSSGSAGDQFVATRWRATDLSGRRSSENASATSPLIHLPNLISKTFLVFNLENGGGNSLDVTLQGKGDSDSEQFANDPSTGPSLSVPAASHVILTTRIAYHLVRLMLRGTVAGSSAKYEVHYIGQTA